MMMGDRSTNSASSSTSSGGIRRSPARIPTVEDGRIARFREENAGAFELHDQPFATAAKRLDGADLADSDVRVFVCREEQTRVNKERLSFRNIVTLQGAVVSGKEHSPPLFNGDFRHEGSFTRAAARRATGEARRNLDVIRTADKRLSRHDPALAFGNKERQQIAWQVQTKGNLATLWRSSKFVLTTALAGGTFSARR